MSTAQYRGQTIAKTKAGYEVMGLVFKTLQNATDAIDAVVV